MPLISWATHVLQWPQQRAARPRGRANPEKRSQFGLQAATRLHEVGIASNGRSAYCREYVPGPCTHRPSHHGSLQHPKSVVRPERGGAAEGGADDWGEVVTR